MTQEEINEKIEACQKKLDDYNVQLEALSKKEEVSEEDQAQFDYILSKGVALKDVIQVPTTKSSISDHLPLTIEID